MDNTLSIPLLVVLLATITAAVVDAWKFKVCNLLTIPLIAAGLIFHTVTGGAAGFLDSLLGAVFGFAILLGLYLLGGMGGGDIKLMAAIGAWLGLPLTFWVLLAGSLVAGAYALGMVVLFGQPQEHWVHFKVLWYRLLAMGRYLGAEEELETAAVRRDRRRVIPFASMLAVGFIFLLAISWFIGRP